jgi:hypothetical protein
MGHGLHASHEKIHLVEPIEAVARVEQAGFGAAVSSDRFSPWSELPGHSAS